jgi:hypothetical protein
VDSAGSQANGSSGGFGDILSADGLQVAFHSSADNLVPGDANANRDAFVHQRDDPVARYFCAGDGYGTACPCGNAGASYEGCANSSGRGGMAAATGSTSVAGDDLVVHSAHLRPATPALLFVGHAAQSGGLGFAFGGGLLCVGTKVVRLGVRIPDVHGDAAWGPGLGAAGGWSPGDTRYFQVWYRDPGGSCGAGYNLTNGLEVILAP